ncbi:MAG: hypothetical protein Q9166_003133 [cf. Caloplaca sp. 2 TL-2023]
MSVDYDNPGSSTLKTRTTDAHEYKRAKKRKREAQAEPESPPVVKKHKSKSRWNQSQIPVTPSKASTPQQGSPFHVQTVSLYLPLPPIAQSHPLQGLCAEHLSPLILTYYAPLRGVVLSFHNARLSADPQQDPPGEAGTVLAQAIGEYAALHVWVTTEFLVFRPQKGNAIEGWINLENEGNIGLVCWNFFNATVERQRLPKDWNWIPGGLDVGGPRNRKKKLKGGERNDPMGLDQEEIVPQVNGVNDIEGHFEDGGGRRIKGLMHFVVKDVESSRSSGGDNGFLSIEGTLLGEIEERRLRESETKYVVSRGRKQQRKEKVAPDEDDDVGAKIPKKSRSRVLWTVNAVRPPYSAAGQEPTIAQLLEQISEIVPLESEDWGLEDYAVEVNGFECLHFSEATHVLKEDDEVCIRPLGTSDLRFRKISGRHQISCDGKHLIDGVAFGRPLLRRANRPPIRIPPRKRRRLADNEDDEGDFEAQRQVVVPTGLGTGEGSLSESDSSEDAVIASDDEEDLNAELVGILNDLDPSIDGIKNPHGPNGCSASLVRDDSVHLDTVARRRPEHAKGLGISGSSLLIDENGTRFPERYDNPLLDAFADDESDRKASSSTQTTQGGRILRSKRRQKDRSRIASSAQDEDKRGAHGMDKRTLQIDKAELDTPATVPLGSSDNSDDADFEPSHDAGVDTDESDKENATPGSEISTDIDVRSQPCLYCVQDGADCVIKEAAELAGKIDSSFSSGSESDTDETSSSGFSTSDSTSSDSGDEAADGTRARRARHMAGDQSTSSSGTSSSSGSSSDSESEQSPREQRASRQGGNVPSPKEVAANARIDSHKEEPKATVPPGSGRRGTKMRNQRRRDRKKILRLQEAGKLPRDATIADLRKLEADPTGQPFEDTGQQQTDPTESENTQFQAKQQALLQAISSENVDGKDNLETNQASSVAATHIPRPSPDSIATRRSGTVIATVEKSTSSSSEKTLIDTGAEATSKEHVGQEEHVLLESSNSQDVSQAHVIHSPSQPVNDVVAVPKPRMRLDMESSRRLLFGALGHRAPKTKEDEVTLQAKLMNDAQFSKKPLPQTVEDNDSGVKSSPSAEQTARWEDKIELSAVECCHDGIELSTPPFPFVQRWDPQQQRGYGHEKTGFSQKSKKRKRNHKHYEASFEPYKEHPTFEQSPYETGTYVQNENPNENSEEQGAIDRDMSDENLQAANEQLLRETEETYGGIRGGSDAPEDLPRLPEDLSACPILEHVACSAGTIIAFKQLDMSSKTNWQPRISEYRSALIDSVLDDGTLSVRMALRDQSHGGKRYDQDTGQRLYSKFEMPGYNEDEIDDNNGLLELAFADLIEPKLVRAFEKEAEPIETDKPSSGAILNADSVESRDQQATIDAQSSIPSDSIVQQALQEIRNPRKDAEVTEQVRREIHDLIKDAGWRSSIQSNGSTRHDNADASQVDQNHEMVEDPQRPEAAQNTNYDGPSSPRFTGFSSSPPAEEYQEAEAQVIYPTLKSASSGPYDETTDDPDRTMADTSSQADREAIQAIREEFEKELIKPAAWKASNDHPQSYDGANSPPIIASEEPKEKSISPPTKSLTNTIPDSQPPRNIPMTLPGSLHKYNHSSSDNDELPDLNTVFTSFSSQRASIKPEHHSSSLDEAFMQTLPSYKSKRNSSPTHSNHNKPPSSSAPARSSDIKTKSKSNKTKSAQRPNRYEAAPRSSQDWIGTQVVDLTMSSDPVAMTMEEEDAVRDGDVEVVDSGGSSLPKGPGWVSKKNKKEKGLRQGGEGRIQMVR